MKYLVHYLKTETPELNKNNVRLEVIGQIWRLPENVQEHLKKSIATLSKNNGLTLIMALSYGSRIEIVERVRQIAEKVKSRQTRPGRHHREGHFRPSLDAERSRSGFAHPHQRRDAREQFSALADFLRRTGHHADALAGFPEAAIFRRAGGIRPAAPAVWRNLKIQVKVAGAKFRNVSTASGLIRSAIR